MSLRYSMALDSVRADSRDNNVLAEISLMQSALLGAPAVLSPNQAMDSLSLQNIILANDRAHSSNPFCDAVRHGIVRIAIDPEQHQNLLASCLASLHRGLDHPENEFIISGLPFLSEKDEDGRDVHPYAERCELARYMIRRLITARQRNFSVPFPAGLGISGTEKELVEKYLASIVMLNDAVGQYETFINRKKQFPRILENLLLARLKAETPGTDTAAVLDLVLNECSVPNAPDNRSYYYHLLKGLRKEHSEEACAEARAVVDVAYNRGMALSVSGTPDLVVPHELQALSGSVLRTDTAGLEFQASYAPADGGTSALDWEQLSWICREVTHIMEAGSLTWDEALLKFRARESRLPFTLAARYILCASIDVSISTLLPGGLAINFAQKLAGDLFTDLTGERFSAPSPKEIRTAAKAAKNARNVLDNVIYKKTESSLLVEG